MTYMQTYLGLIAIVSAAALTLYFMWNEDKKNGL